MWRRIFRATDLVLFVLLTVFALWLMYWQNNRLDAGSVATLVGALFGAAAVLLGNWISRSNERAKTAEDLERHRAQLQALVTAELVNVAAGLIGASETLEAARGTLEAKGGTVSLDMSRDLPREMPFTYGLGVDLWILERPAVDALVTLRSNLDITRGQMEAITLIEGGAWRTQVISLANGVRHTIGVLEKCFRHIAPDRKLALPNRPAELATAVLERIARDERA